ncbi:MAG: carbon-nitrogen family hydrolase [Bacillota bacterium]
MRVGLCQLDIAWEDKLKNQIKAKQYIKEASGVGVSLLLFPEMTLTGFSMNIDKTAEANAETLNFFKEQAIRYQINIGFGWVEAVQSRARNHYSVVSASGVLLSDYVKIHPFSYGGESTFFDPGNKVECFKIDGVGMASFICYDLRFPEIFQAVSNNTDLIIVAANWPELRKKHWRILLKARAIENQVYIVGINCVGIKGGLTYSGNSMIIEPEGNIIGEVENREELVIADIMQDKVIVYREQFPLKSDRRVELYKSLL